MKTIVEFIDGDLMPRVEIENLNFIPRIGEEVDISGLLSVEERKEYNHSSKYVINIHHGIQADEHIIMITLDSDLDNVNDFYDRMIKQDN